MSGSKSQLKRRIHDLIILLIAAAVVGAAAFFIFRPIPPKLYPDLSKYDQLLTVSHSRAIRDAQLTEQNSKYIVDILSDSRFKAVDQKDIDFADELTLCLERNAEMALKSVDGSTYAQLTVEDDTEVYKLNRDVYGEIKDIIYSSFPGGVQVLDLQPWWEQYLAFTTQSILKYDFNSPKEIPVDAVIKYTYLQMVADGTAKDFEVTDENGVRKNVMPYQMFLIRAREYFTDGAGPSMKQSPEFDAALGSFVFKAPPEEQYGNYPFTDYSDYRANNNFALKSLTRDFNGNITAVFEDYNRLGLQGAGGVSQIYSLTMVSSSDGEYRFVSNMSNLANPASVSIEGFFMRVGDLGDLSADAVYDAGYAQAGIIGGDYLLYATKYTREKATIELLRISPIDGKVVARGSLEADSATVFWDVRATENGALVKTSREAILLGPSLERERSVLLPIEQIPNLHTIGFDVSDDLSRIVYTNDTGLYELSLSGGSPVLLAEHPSSGSESGNFLRFPTYIQDDAAVLVVHMGPDAVTGYSMVQMGERKPEQNYRLIRLDISDVPIAFDYVDEEKLVVQFPNSEHGQGQPATRTIQIVHHFKDYRTTSFQLAYDADAPDRLVYGEYMYYFARNEDDIEDGDVVFKLRQINMNTLVSETLPITIMNASPRILAATEDGKILFSYRSPSGSGFGITSLENYGGQE